MTYPSGNRYNRRMNTKEIALKTTDQNCSKCALHLNTPSVCIPGSFHGEPNPNVIIIGEAPGANEELNIQVFSGKSGALLRNALNIMGIEGYVTNSVKCRPKYNRTPKKSELNACSEYLHREFDLLKPQYVLLLGNTAMEAVCGFKGITSYRGKAMVEDGRIYFPVYHPAYVLRFPEEEQTWLKDLERFKAYVDGRESEIEQSLNYKIIDNLRDRKQAFKHIMACDEVSLDLETSGLNPFEEDAYVTSIGIGTDTTQYCFILNHRASQYHGNYVRQLVIARQIAEAIKDRTVIAQNGKFDSLWLKEIFDITVDIDFDTMLASYMLNEDSKHSLDYMSSKYFAAENYDVPLNVKFGIEGSLDEHCRYLALDVMYTFKLKQIFLQELYNDMPTYNIFTDIIMPISNLYRDAEYEGLFISPEKLSEAGEYFRNESAKYLKKLNKYGEINWRSTAQVKQMLFEVMGLPVLDKTKTGAPSTSESVLKRLEHPVAGDLIKYRKANQNVSFFIDGWTKRMDSRSFIHPTFKVGGTVTGRPSCKDPNLQQTPRDPRIRSIIDAPEGWELIEVDISQAELRIAAEMSQCPGLIRAFRSGVDIHTKIVQNTFGIMNPTSEERKKGKAINFGFLYGMGWNKFVTYARDNYDTVVTHKEAKRARDTYFQTWPGLLTWHKKQVAFAQNREYVRSLIGRKRRLPNINHGNNFERAESERQAINAPVQSLASDWNLCAALEMREKFDSEYVRVIGTVHDSVLLMAKENIVEWVAKSCVDIMVNPKLISKVFRLQMSVPMQAEAKIGPWGKGHTGIS